MKPEIKVFFQQLGTWGGRSFTASLALEDQVNLFTGEPTDAPPTPVLILDDGQDGWSGLRVRPGQVIPGRFGTGFNSSLSGKYYLGSMEFGDDALNLKSAILPSEVFPLGPSYLHLYEPDDPVTLTPEQRALLLRAIRFDLNDRFPAGADVVALFSREELEGDKQGQIYYNR